MRRNLVLRLCAFFAIAGLTGCTTPPLRRITVHQAWSVGDIQQMQVMNNLAMFVYEPNSLPSFSIPNQSANNITDVGSAQLTPVWSRASTPSIPFIFNSFTSQFTASRTFYGSFTLTPVNDPRKLELMRCAYQKAVQSCGYGNPSEACPDCQTVQKKFYTGDPNGDIDSIVGGTVSSECIATKGCWFHVTRNRKCVPKHCDCTYIGEYCGIYVWVDRDGRDELAKLTLTILDYALNSPPTAITKQVTYYIDEYGLPTNQAEAVGQVMANINVAEQPGSLMTTPQADEARIEQMIDARLSKIDERMNEIQKQFGISSETQGTSPNTDVAGRVAAVEYKELIAERQSLLRKKEYLNEQLRTPALKQQYFPSTPAPIIQSPWLQWNLQQQFTLPK
jgi:hypothetical protein